MTDINASLKKTIDGEPGPQYKEKNKAEFNFAEGEDGVPYTYDKKVESRLTAIENKLDSVIENGSVNTQLTNGIEVSNLPETQKVEITNQKESQDVKVTNQPEDYPDKSVKTELELIKQENVAIKESQAEIIEALKVSNENLQSTNEVLNSVIKDDRLQSDTQLTGSNVGDDNPLPTKTVDYGSRLEQIDLMVNVLVPANSFHNLSSVISEFKSPNIAFTMELDVSAKCRVYVYPLSETGQTLTRGGSRTIFNLDGSKDNDETLAHILHQRNIIYFQNQSDVDITVQRLTMTQHL